MGLKKHSTIKKPLAKGFFPPAFLAKLSLSLGMSVLLFADANDTSPSSESLDQTYAYVWQVDDPDQLAPGDIPSQYRALADAPFSPEEEEGNEALEIEESIALDPDINFDPEMTEMKDLDLESLSLIADLPLVPAPLEENLPPVSPPLLLETTQLSPQEALTSIHTTRLYYPLVHELPIKHAGSPRASDLPSTLAAGVPSSLSYSDLIGSPVPSSKKQEISFDSSRSTAFFVHRPLKKEEAPILFTGSEKISGNVLSPGVARRQLISVFPHQAHPISALFFSSIEIPPSSSEQPLIFTGTALPQEVAERPPAGLLSKNRFAALACFPERQPKAPDALESASLTLEAVTSLPLNVSMTAAGHLPPQVPSGASIKAFKVEHAGWSDGNQIPVIEPLASAIATLETVASVPVIAPMTTAGHLPPQAPSGASIKAFKVGHAGWSDGNQIPVIEPLASAIATLETVASVPVITPITTVGHLPASRSTSGTSLRTFKVRHAGWIDGNAIHPTEFLSSAIATLKAVAPIPVIVPMTTAGHLPPPDREENPTIATGVSPKLFKTAHHAGWFDGSSPLPSISKTEAEEKTTNEGLLLDVPLTPDATWLAATGNTGVESNADLLPNSSLFAPLPEAQTAPQEHAAPSYAPPVILSPQTDMEPEAAPAASTVAPTEVHPSTPANEAIPEAKPAAAAHAEAEQAPKVVRAAELNPPADDSPATLAAKKNEKLLVLFNNIDIVEYLNFISKLSGKNFVFDDADLNFKVSIVSNEPTTVENMMTALLQELSIHGLALMEVGNNLIIHRNYKNNSPATLVKDGESYPLDSEIVTQVIRLNNSPPDKIAMIIKPMLSELSIVEGIPETSHLIITDLTANVEKIQNLVKSLDTPATGMEIGQYVVSNASVDAAIALAERILTPLAQGKSLVFVPHPATNSVYVVSTPYLVEKAIHILQQIDVNEGSTRILSVDKMHLSKEEQERLEREGMLGGFGPNGGNGEGGGKLGSNKAGKWASNLPLGYVESTKFFIKKLQYQKGDKLVDSLKRVADSLIATGVQNTSLITTINSIQWLEASNSLVYTGTEESIMKVSDLIDEVDIPLRQVLIEVLVIETTIDDSMRFGVNFGSRFREDSTAGAQAFISNLSPLSAAMDTTFPGGTFDASLLARAAGYSLGIMGRNVSFNGFNFNSLGALVTALHDDAKTNIVLNPKIVVEDNAPAEIFVGINTPFQTQAIANEFGNIITSNFEYRDIGSTLKVTPLIGNNDIITMEIEQEVSTIATLLNTVTTATTSGIGTTIPVNGQGVVDPGPTTRKSKTTTKIHIPDGYFVILSGMIQDEDDFTRHQVPCLGGLPVIGAAFSDRNHVDSKRNLLIFIRPQIVRNEEIDSITKREQDIFKEKGRVKKRWQAEVDEAYDFLNLKHLGDPEWKPY